MTDRIFKFKLADHVNFTEAEATLGLARIAAESLHGRDRLIFEHKVTVDRAANEIFIATSGIAGYEMAVIFSGFMWREFGRENVRVTQ